MENKLKALFDYHKFNKNDHLERLIVETEKRQKIELSDDELGFVSAAGDIFEQDSSNKMK